MSVVKGQGIRRREGSGAPSTLAMANPPNVTHFHPDTAPQVRRVVEDQLAARKQGGGMRLRFHYGDPTTGQAWGDSETGYVGRSTGQIKIPLVVHNARSMGGGGLLDKNVVKIEGTRKDRSGNRPVLYQHPDYHEGG